MEGVANWDQLPPEAQSQIEGMVSNHFPGGFAAGDNSAQQLSVGFDTRDVLVAACKVACSAAQAAMMAECPGLAEIPPPFGELAIAACEAAAVYQGGKCRDACDNM